MDIHVTADEPTREEREAVDSVLGKAESGWSGGQRHIELEGRFALGGHTDRARRHLLLPVLHVIQRRVGWISPGALNYVSARLDIPPAGVRRRKFLRLVFDHATPAPGPPCLR